MAKEAGFEVEMRYVALKDFFMTLERVKSRADKGGHSAPETVLRRIYEASLRHLVRAIHEVDELRVYDNSEWGAAPLLLLESKQVEIVYRRATLPAWLVGALAGV